MTYLGAMHMSVGGSRVLEGVHCSIVIARPAERTVVVQIVGLDVGELGRTPFSALDEVIKECTPLEMFIDARDARGPSVDVSAHWAGWLRANREHFQHINMLTRSRFVQLTADFVQHFAELGDRMRIFTDPSAFDTALQLAVR